MSSMDVDRILANARQFMADVSERVDTVDGVGIRKGLEYLSSSWSSCCEQGSSQAALAPS